ncbi:hypothetical protein OG874_00565 [Nocardia sp. NBC_00565]|uniref:hypothetical protein n=1 Tax=Nocardia sp. NBC_00565 TaxID=2975993 RepID=UPI002E817F7F|nr:hypothetical protein [Nocardia sp. NBC_00565]WUC03748.1 hypothetical protein OG874_00565 [Nocardia sp. NBC_00565]
MAGLTVILHGGDGSTWHVHGDGAGAEGVWCAYNAMKGVWDPPVRTAWASGARQRGGKPRGRWYDPRDLDLGFHLVASRVPGGDQESLMSAFRNAFDFREDDYDFDAVLPRIQVISQKSTRDIDVQLRQHIDFDPPTDPVRRQHADPVLPLRAGNPFYYETPEISTWSTGSSSGSGTVPVWNPTPIPMFHKWILTRGDWTLPDRSIEGPKHHRFIGSSKRTGRDDSGRDILIAPIGTVQGGATVDLDPDALMIRDAHGTNMLGQMPVPGMYFEYEIPPWTQPLELPVSVTNAPAGGAMVQLVMPRLWPLPIGGQ